MGDTALSAAARFSCDAAARALLAVGAEMWEGLTHFCITSPVSQKLLLELEQCYLAGTLQASGHQPTKLAYLLSDEPTRAEAVLRAALERGATLTPAEASPALL